MRKTRATREARAKAICDKIGPGVWEEGGPRFVQAWALAAQEEVNDWQRSSPMRFMYERQTVTAMRSGRE